MRKKKKLLSVLVFLILCTLSVYTEGMSAQDDTIGSGGGETYVSVSDVPLSQMKVAMPIKIDFVVAPLSAEADSSKGANKVYVGEYKMEVLATSEVDVELIGIQLNPKNGWEATSTLNPSIRQLQFKMAQSKSPNQLLIDSSQENSLFDVGNTTKVNNIQNFIVQKGTSKGLGIQILSHIKTKIQSSDVKASEEAFEVIYTVQKHITTP